MADIFGSQYWFRVCMPLGYISDQVKGLCRQRVGFVILID